MVVGWAGEVVVDPLNIWLGVGGVAQREVDGVASRRFFEEVSSEVLRVTERIETS